jgi:Na+/melibiose symporter-like transporter
VTPWAAGLGLVAAVAFVVVERRTREPMVPLGLFADRTFSAANLMTLLVYAALGAILFFLVLQLQTVGGYGALAAGLATLPITACMLFLAARGGALGERIGPRIPMTFGPIVMAAGTLWLLVVGPDVVWWRDVAPGLTVFGLGLALMVAPLTATVLAAAPDEVAGVASGINNAVARAGSLLAVAALPMAVGLAGDDYRDPARFDTAYGSAMVACAVLLVVGGVVSWFTIPARVRTPAPAA